MKIELNKTFKSNSKVDELDVRQIKKALNRLGYYTPYEKTGIIGVPDRAVFDSLKQFQRDQGLAATGMAKPGDETIESLNAQISKEPEGTYIWRSVEDGKVRSSHAAYNRTERAWSDSPDPGEEFNCRCWVEPSQARGSLKQVVISQETDEQAPWTDLDFVTHFYFGGGQEKHLHEIGLLGAVIEHAQETMFDKVLSQVREKSQAIKNGPITGSWSRPYNFGAVVFSLGGVTIRGIYGGTVKTDGNLLVVDVKAEYEFSDTFTDPFNKRQNKIGTSALEDVPYNKSKPWWHPQNLGAGYLVANTEYMGTPYTITGKWVTQITGTVTLEQQGK